ncbi:hypothetical protein OROHE_020046 [Orobanche hederae]
MEENSKMEKLMKCVKGVQAASYVIVQKLETSIRKESSVRTVPNVAADPLHGKPGLLGLSRPLSSFMLQLPKCYNNISLFESMPPKSPPPHPNTGLLGLSRPLSSFMLQLPKCYNVSLFASMPPMSPLTTASQVTTAASNTGTVYELRLSHCKTNGEFVIHGLLIGQIVKTSDGLKFAGISNTLDPREYDKKMLPKVKKEIEKLPKELINELNKYWYSLFNNNTKDEELKLKWNKGVWARQLIRHAMLGGVHNFVLLIPDVTSYPRPPIKMSHYWTTTLFLAKPFLADGGAANIKDILAKANFTFGKTTYVGYYQFNNDSEESGVGAGASERYKKSMHPQGCKNPF